MRTIFILTSTTAGFHDDENLVTAKMKRVNQIRLMTNHKNYLVQNKINLCSFYETYRCSNVSIHRTKIIYQREKAINEQNKHQPEL